MANENPWADMPEEEGLEAATDPLDFIMGEPGLMKTMMAKIGSTVAEEGLVQGGKMALKEGGKQIAKKVAKDAPAQVYKPIFKSADTSAAEPWTAAPGSTVTRAQGRSPVNNSTDMGLPSTSQRLRNFQKQTSD